MEFLFPRGRNQGNFFRCNWSRQDTGSLAANRPKGKKTGVQLPGSDRHRREAISWCALCDCLSTFASHSTGLPTRIASRTGSVAGETRSGPKVNRCFRNWRRPRKTYPNLSNAPLDVAWNDYLTGVEKNPHLRKHLRIFPFRLRELKLTSWLRVNALFICTRS
jgi:hypothetical protein